MRSAVLVFAVHVVACDAPTRAVSSAPITTGDECADVQLSGDPADPRSLVIENGVARVTYPQLDSGNDQLGAHMLELKLDGEWRRVLGSWYGDWTYFIAPLTAPATRAQVITETSDAVEVAFEFDHAIEFPVTAHDFRGQPIFVHNTHDDTLKLEQVKFIKVIRVERCLPGYFVGYHTIPTLHWGDWVEDEPNSNGTGEREHGFGWMASVTFASSGVVVRNPEAGTHRSLGITEQAEGPWWFASMPPPGTDPAVVLYLAQEHAMPSFVWQFDPAHLGIPLVYKMNPQLEADGRTGRYQSFLGAFAYQPTDRDAEPTLDAIEGVKARLPTTWL